LRRAGLDYHEFAVVQRHRDWQAFVAECRPAADRLFAFSTHASRSFADQSWRDGDWLIFGNESGGLGGDVLAEIAPAQRLRLPMRAGQRSLNLSNAVAVAVFEAWRQLGYEGGL
jgi:tRNA (cytidine/uridine-2'-O-)-methyltransferase